ncbi:hypothetical protein [Sphingomonas sp. 3-13AW]|uniref:hypothetical protein n=1 Tax=Sphingomonas sp. 3-13AW TaxID=3050450 RepID=UPI003BB7C0F8
MVLHVDEAVYTEYDQLCHVNVSVVDRSGKCVMRRRPIDALAAEGIVRPIETDRFNPITYDFLSEVCRDHAPAIHARYVAPAGRYPAMAGGSEDVAVGDGLSEIRFPLKVSRSERIFA